MDSMSEEKKKKTSPKEDQINETEEQAAVKAVESKEKMSEKKAKETESKEKALEEKVKMWEEKYTRLYAEYDNYQKRSHREKDARYADAVIDTVAALLPVADNLERALATEVQSDDAKTLQEGVQMVKKQFDDALSKLEVSAIEAEGKSFDPNLHNAVMHVEDESIDDNTVVEELMKGYIYKKDRVVRHSMVKVAN